MNSRKKPNMPVNRNKSMYAGQTRKGSKVVKHHSMRPLDSSIRASKCQSAIIESEIYSQLPPEYNPTHYSNQNTYLQHNHPTTNDTATTQSYTQQYVNNIPDQNNVDNLVSNQNYDSNTNTALCSVSRINSVNEGVRNTTTSILRNKVDKTRSFAQRQSIPNATHRISTGSNINRTNTISYMPHRINHENLPKKKTLPTKVHRNKSERIFDPTSHTSNLVRNNTDANAYYTTNRLKSNLKTAGITGPASNNTVVFRHESIVGNGKAIPYVHRSHMQTQSAHIPDGVTYENMTENLVFSPKSPSAQDLTALAKYDLANLQTSSPNLSRTDSKLPILDNATVTSDSSQEHHQTAKINVDLISHKKSLRELKRHLSKKSLKSIKSNANATVKSINVVATNENLAAPEVTVIYPNVDNTKKLSDKLDELQAEPLAKERRIKYLVLMLIVFICVSVAVFGSVVYLKNVFDKRKLATDAQDSRYIEFFNTDKNTDLH